MAPRARSQCDARLDAQGAAGPSIKAVLQESAVPARAEQIPTESRALVIARGEHIHIEADRTTRHRFSDTPKTYQSQGCAFQLDTQV